MIAFMLTSWLMTHAEVAKLPIPVELYQRIEKEFSLQKADLKPELSDVEVSIHGPQGEQKSKVGYTQEILDLSSLVDLKWEDFALSFHAPFDIDGATLYYVSRYKPSMIGTEKMGLPCGQALKIESKLKDLFSTHGVKVMTKGAHYLNLLGGDYLLAKKDGKKLHIAYFKIRDGRSSHRLCNMTF